MRVPERLLYVFVFSCLGLFLCARHVDASDKEKDKYRIDKMPPARFLTPERSEDDYRAYGIGACPDVFAVDGDAYDLLEAVVALGDRRTGSQEYRCAAEVVKNTLAAMGYDVELMEYNFPYYEVEAGSFHVRRTSNGVEYDSFPLMYSPPTATTEGRFVRGEVTRPRLGKDLSGRVVLFKPNIISRHLDKKALKWQEKGAVGLIVPAGMWPNLGKELPYPSRAHSTSYHYSGLPGFVVAYADELLGEEVEMKNPSRIFCGKGFNVVAKTPGDHDEYIVVSGHLDAWYGGALDDGTGVAAMVEAADMLKDEKHEVGVIYLAADGEEIGLIGSAEFTRRFGLGKVKAMVELDMVSSIYNYGEAPLDEPDRLMTRFVAATPQVKPFAREVFSGLDSKVYYIGPPVWRSLYGGLPTDMEWFYAAGIPSVFLYCPAKYYHTERDSMEWMHREDLNDVAAGVADLIRRLQDADLPERVPNTIKIDFDAQVMEDGKIEFRIDLPGRPKRADVKVYCYYELGFEREIECERNDESVYIGTYSPPYVGSCQFLAMYNKGKSFGQAWQELKVDRPGPPEEDE